MASKITAVPDEQAPAGADIVQPLTSRSLFWQANYLTGGPATEMLSFLFWCVESAVPRVLVSLSRASGESYFAMCQTVERLSLDTRCFNIAAGAPSETMREHNTNNFEDFSTLLDSIPADAAARFADHSIDLLYVDLAHLPEDLAVWKAKLSPRGVLLLHGVHRPECAQAYADCLAQLGIKTIDFTLEHGAGMGVVLNPETPVRLARLAQMTLGQPGYAEVQKVFFRLGKAQQNAHLARDAEHRQRQMDAEIAEMRKQAKQAQADVDTATSKTAKLREAYEARNQHTALVEARHFDTVTALQERVDALQKAHDAQVQDAASLTGQVTALEAVVTDLNTQIADLAAQNTNLTTQNADLTSTHADLTKQLQNPQSALEDQTRIEELTETTARQARELGAMVQGFEEIREAYEAKQTWLRDTLAKAKSAAEATAAEHAERVQTLTADLTAQKEDALAALTNEHDARIQLLNSAIAELKGQTEVQTDELVALTTLLEKQGAQRAAEQEWQTVRIELRDAEIAMLRGSGGRLRRGDAPSRAGLPSVKKQIEILKSSDLFDAAWYLKTYVDVAQSGADPAHHYVTHGALDGRNPGPAFDTMGYYLANRDVAQRGFNALVHYVMFGRDEKRKLHKAP